MLEIITGGILEGEIIRDGILINGSTDKPAFKKATTNAYVIMKLRERGFVREVSE